MFDLEAAAPSLRRASYTGGIQASSSGDLRDRLCGVLVCRRAVRRLGVKR